MTLVPPTHPGSSLCLLPSPLCGVQVSVHLLHLCPGGGRGGGHVGQPRILCTCKLLASKLHLNPLRTASVAEAVSFGCFLSPFLLPLLMSPSWEPWQPFPSSYPLLWVGVGRVGWGRGGVDFHAWHIMLGFPSGQTGVLRIQISY